jgi:hypothetical protein
MLSIAKHLESYRERPFAMLRVTRKGQPPWPNGILDLCFRLMPIAGAIMQINFLIGIAGNLSRADKSAMGAMNRPLRMVWTSKHGARADKSAVGAMNRPLRMSG